MTSLEGLAPLSIEQLYARYRIYDAPTIRTLLAKPLPQAAPIEEQWLSKYSRPTKSGLSACWTPSALWDFPWRAPLAPNLAAWTKGKGVDPSKLIGAVRTADPKVGVP